MSKDNKNMRTQDGRTKHTQVKYSALNPTMWNLAWAIKLGKEWIDYDANTGGNSRECGVRGRREKKRRRGDTHSTLLKTGKTQCGSGR